MTGPRKRALTTPLDIPFVVARVARLPREAGVQELRLHRGAPEGREQAQFALIGGSAVRDRLARVAGRSDLPPDHEAESSEA